MQLHCTVKINAVGNRFQLQNNARFVKQIFSELVLPELASDFQTAVFSLASEAMSPLRES